MSNDPINPDYYHINGIECIDVQEAIASTIDDPAVAFSICTMIGYVWRAWRKHGTPVHCLLKARWFLDRALARYGYKDDDATCNGWIGNVETGEVKPAPTPPPAGLDLSRVVGEIKPLALDLIRRAWSNTEAQTHWDAFYAGCQFAEFHHADRLAREATPPPAPAIPELPPGETPTVPGRYWVQYTDGDIRVHDIQDVAGWASPKLRFAGPIPPPSFARDGREGGEK